MDEWKAKLPDRFKRMRRDTPARRALAWFVEHFPEIVTVVGGSILGWVLANTMPLSF